jgi:leucyl-tRNA synthetase
LPLTTRADDATPPHRYGGRLANEIERKWRDRWDAEQAYYAPNPAGSLTGVNAELAERPPYYVLDMFPYPSGSGLHVGHPLGYIGTDVFARFKRMEGFNVLHAMGYDAFGLPAERYAVETGQHPSLTTDQNIATMRRQLHRIGLGHDARRGVKTTDPGFYRWTQWIFLQIYNAWYDPARDAARPISELVAALDAGTRELPAEVAGDRPWSELDERERRRSIDRLRLAYLDEVMVNWCPALGTVLANEEVSADGRSEQGGFPVYRRPLRQWMMRITAYADRLIEDLEGLDWPDSLKLMQRNWIGRSDGAEVTFTLDAGDDALTVFTTRPDTLHGVTFLAVAPDHPLLKDGLPAAYPDDTPAAWRGEAAGLDAPGAGFASPAEACAAYARRFAARSDRQRQEDDRATGVYTGIDAVHPLSGRRVPVFAADYVLMGYGSGAVMGVPAHDARDLRFARTLGLPVEVVVEPPAGWFAAAGLEPGAPPSSWPDAYPGHGRSAGGDETTDGRPSTEVAGMLVDALEAAGRGRRQRAYKLRDWLFSRQRYWGEPFPIVYDEAGDPHALPDDVLPVALPDLDDFAPVVGADEDTEPSPPLARAGDWLEVELDLGDGPRRYRRETNTMPQWAGSCWYYLRYLDPDNDDAPVDPSVERYWMGGDADSGGVDLYVGGVEHAVLHLLYSRFWHKVLYDLGHVSTLEPFHRLFNQGMVQADAFTDERGFFVPAAEVVQDPGGGWSHEGRPVDRHYGKMGKSLKNGVAPDEIIDAYGADALRVYELFLAPLDQDRPWDTQGITGVARFLQRVWRYVVDEETGALRVSDAELDGELERALHRTVAAVRRDIERLHFNTAIAAMMELSKELRASGQADAPPRALAEWLVLILAPFAPHMCAELWERLGHTDSVVYARFPEPDERLLEVRRVNVAVQVNGKVRGVVEVPAGLAEDELKAEGRGLPRVASLIGDAEVRRVIVVPDRLVNFVVA